VRKAREHTVVPHVDTYVFIREKISIWDKECVAIHGSKRANIGGTFLEGTALLLCIHEEDDLSLATKEQ